MMQRADAWEKAKKTWSKYVRLQEPDFLETPGAIKDKKMVNEVARIGLADLKVAVNLAEINGFGLADHLDVVLAHEVGHHVLAPGNLMTWARLADYISNIFPSKQSVLFVINIFTDLIVNDALFTQKGMPVHLIYKAMKREADSKGMTAQSDEFWQLYMRIYEVLWQLPAGTLCGTVKPEIERDAKLSARILRTFSKKWFVCLKNLAFIFKAYIPEQVLHIKGALPSFDNVVPGEGGMDTLWGFTSMGDEETGKPEELKYDGALGNIFKDEGNNNQKTGATRTPMDYIRAIEFIGALESKDRAVIQYYTELAFPHLVPFPAIDKPVSESIPEGSDQWTVGESIDELNILESVKESPVIIPGVTTRKLVEGEDKGMDTNEAPIDIDIYMDTSGSMGDPAVFTSFPTIAAFIIVLSALRAGASVQATSWSGVNQARSTNGFSKNKEEILGTIIHFFGDGTQFPCQVLERYEKRTRDAPPVHIIVISDDDIQTMVGPYASKDASGATTERSGEDTVRMAIDKGKAEGSLLLRTYTNQKSATVLLLETLGFEYHRVADWKELIEFARNFSRKNFTNIKRTRA